MRSVSTAVLAAQKQPSLSPSYKIQLTLDANDDTWDERRILSISHTEEASHGAATVVLDNSDLLITADYKGYQGIISYGVNGTYSGGATAPMIVVDQVNHSSPGLLTTTLTLQGLTDHIAQDHANTLAILLPTDVRTIKALITAVLGATLSPFSHCRAFTATFDSEDSLIDTFVPAELFVVGLNATRLAMIERLLTFTKNVMRVEADGAFHFLNPTVSGSSYNYEYALDVGGSHNIFNKATRTQLVMPNRVIVTPHPDSTADFFAGDAEYTDSSDITNMEKREHWFLEAASGAQANAVAAAIIQGYMLDAQRGAAEVPMNVGQEVHDYINLTDSRQGDTRAGNIGSILREAGGGKWAMRFAFGSTARGGFLGLDVPRSGQSEPYNQSTQIELQIAEDPLATQVAAVESRLAAAEDQLYQAQTGPLNSSGFNVGASAAALMQSSRDFGSTSIPWRHTYTKTLWGAGGIRFVIDNTDTEIQNAVDDVEAAGGGTVHLPAGTYPISTKILLDANVPLKFTGYGAILEAQNGLDFIIHVDRVNGATAEFCSIEGVVLDGASVSITSGLRIEDTDRVVLKKVTIKDVVGIGLDLYAGANAGASPSWVEGCHISDVWISGCTVGVRFNRGAQGDYTSFFENHFTDVGVQGCATGWLIDRYANLTRCTFDNTVTWIGNNQIGWDIRGDMKEVQADLHVESGGTPTNVIGVSIGANTFNLKRWVPHYSFVGAFTTKILDNSHVLEPAYFHIDIFGWHAPNVGATAVLTSSGAGGDDYSYWLMDNDNWSGIRGWVRVPDDYIFDGEPIAIVLLWTTIDANAAHKVRWSVRVASLTPTADNADQAIGGLGTSGEQQDFSDPVDLQIKETFYRLTSLTGINRSDWLRITILREGGHGDDDATSAYLLGLSIAYKRNT